MQLCCEANNIQFMSNLFVFIHCNSFTAATYCSRTIWRNTCVNILHGPAGIKLCSEYCLS